MDNALLSIGLSAVLIGFATLAFMVHRELGPFAGLNVAGRWLLTGLFGMGFVAFGIKMAVALAIERLPEQTIAPLLAMQAVAARGDEQFDTGFINPAPARQAHYVWEALPEAAPEPADNPGNAAKVALGQRLFNEKKLSGDGTLSCTSCHDLSGHAGADARPTALGIDQQTGPRNTPTVWNAAFMSRLFWDGRAATLEEQATGPILNPIEMGLPTSAEAERRLRQDANYRNDFARAFGDRQPITFERIAQAIAAYERTLITPDAPYDRFVRGDATALNPAQLRGMALFESLGCVLCHRGPSFSDAGLIGGESAFRIFPANATPYEKQYDLLLDGKRGTWRIASLRNVALTGPWLHNGSVDKLENVVRIMASAQLGRSGKLNTWLNDDRQLGKADRSPIGDKEVADLVAFLEALSSDRLVVAEGKEKK
ncbi:MAG: cytochrome-c peroxidase [Betaproteobacteria bacterium HGW-Betaproteobacteria-4]|jgi:cytochrome c peroxidase|nr:MAG: cytochrome-c peroxidase [Betaproteobacteria bacterium HGW-Betaproteobacteria-4]